MDGAPWPSAVVDGTGWPDPALLAAEEADEDGETLADDDGDGDGEAAAAAPSWLAPTAWPEPADGDGLTDAPFAFGFVDVDGVADVEGEGDGVGVVVGTVVLLASRITWRSRSNAVSPTSVATFSAPAPGTETTISFLPCWVTVEPVRPVASTRLVMI